MPRHCCDVSLIRPDMGGDSLRVGLGFDAHRLGGPPPLKLAGVVVDDGCGTIATSDGDVAAHAVADAVLGATALGDLGALFPSEDGRWGDADSMDLLARVVELLESAGMSVGNMDLTVIAETVRVAPHREEMRAGLAAVLRVDVGRVSVKATTTDGMGFAGRGEGIAAWATVLLVGEPPESGPSPVQPI